MKSSELQLPVTHLKAGSPVEKAICNGNVKPCCAVTYVLSPTESSTGGTYRNKLLD